MDRTAFKRLSLAEHPGELPDAIALAFDPLEGEAAQFERFGIACPPSVKRSAPKRKAEYLAGRRVALRALNEAGIAVDNIGIGPLREPQWPKGYVGSITHSNGIALAVATLANELRGVGIDLESVAAADAVAAIRQLVLSPTEERALSALASRVGEATAMTIAFSAKESFYKATATTVGRLFDFNALRITAACADQGIVEASVAEALAPGLVPGRVFFLGFSVVSGGAVMTSFIW